MMDVQLTVDVMLDRATTLFPDREIVTKNPDGSVHRYTYAQAYDRICQLAHALDDLNVGRGERIATVARNNYRHYELYFAPACTGRCTHMCNPQLPDEHFQYIINDAEDKVVFVDPDLLEKVSSNSDSFESVEQFVVLGETVPDGVELDPVVAYEELLDDYPTTYEWPDLEEEEVCGMCYTSGTTGKPKGVEYTHRSIYLHSFMVGHTDAVALGESDAVLPVVPMYHANAWGYPYAATLVGAKQVLPDSNTTPAQVANLIEAEGVTLSAAVPTVWLEMAQYLDEHQSVDISNIDRLVVGGSAPPESLIRKFDEEYDAPIIEGWGMTEMSPLGSLSVLRREIADADPETRYRYRATGGIPVPGVQTRIMTDEGEVAPNDGETMGELQVRGPTVAGEYHNRPDANRESFTDDGWLLTGDIATQDELGYLEIVDRTKDVIKSGGEWISSVELENELMAHEAVVEASVIGVEHEKWQERPVACIVLREGKEVDSDGLDDHLSERFPSWWLPDAYEFVDEIPRTSTGKFDKLELRNRYGDVKLQS